MIELSAQVQRADWKQEKHVPVIECPESVKPDQVFRVEIAIGKEIPHPNTTEHHIRWVALYFHPDGAKSPQEVGRFEFSAHGASTDGPNQGPVYTGHAVAMFLKVKKPGTLHALALCNIHGLWEGSREIKVS